MADVGTEERIRERIEAAVMGVLYSGPSPLCDIPDKGMFLALRRESERPIVATNLCPVKLHGLPARFEETAVSPRSDSGVSGGWLAPLMLVVRHEGYLVNRVNV